MRGKKKGPQSKINWDLLERRIASNEKAYQRQIIRKKIDELVAVLRAVPPGARPAVDSRRGDHLVRREAEFRAGRERLVGRPPEGARARRHPARDRRPAPPAGAARRHRSLRRRAVHRAGDHFRSPSRRSRRPDVRDDQRQAHAPQRVAPGVAVRAASCIATKRSPRRTTWCARSTIARIRRCYGEIKLLGVGKGRVGQAPLAQELKKLFADEDALGGAAQERTVPRGVEEVLRQLLQADRERSSSRRGTAASTASSRRRRCARSSASRPT